MQWVWPWQAAAGGLTLAGVLGLLAWRARRRRQALAQWLGGPLAGGLAGARGRRGVRLGLLVATLGVVLLGLARPRGPVRLTAGEVGGTVLVLLDVSASMRATDVLPSRFEAARQWLTEALPQFPAARLGLLAFAGEAQVLCPPTADHALVLDLLRHLPMELALREGSELGSGLALARTLLERAGGGGTILLVTDGEYHDPQPGAALARGSSVDLVTLTLGGATPVPVPGGGGGGPVLDPRDGHPALSAARPEAMRELAAAVGGGAVVAGQPGAGLAEAMDLVARGAARRVSSGLVATRREVGPWVLMLALGLLFVRLWLADRPVVRGRGGVLPAGLFGLVLLGASAIGVGSGAGAPGEATEVAALRQESLQAPGHDRHRCLYNLGRRLQQDGADDEARRTYLEALSLPGCPRTVRARCLTNLGALGLARAYDAAGREPATALAAVLEARAALAEAARLEPGLTAAALNLNAAAALADTVQAQYDLAQALARSPGAAPRPPAATGDVEAGIPPPAAAVAPALSPGPAPVSTAPSGVAGGPAAAGDLLQRLTSTAGSSQELLQRLQARRGTALPALRLPW